jgi:hypothetical protein
MTMAKDKEKDGSDEPTSIAEALRKNALKLKNQKDPRKRLFFALKYMTTSVAGYARALGNEGDVWQKIADDSETAVETYTAEAVKAIVSVIDEQIDRALKKQRAR